MRHSREGGLSRSACPGLRLRQRSFWPIKGSARDGDFCDRTACPGTVGMFGPWLIISAARRISSNGEEIPAPGDPAMAGARRKNQDIAGRDSGSLAIILKVINGGFSLFDQPPNCIRLSLPEPVVRPIRRFAVSSSINSSIHRIGMGRGAWTSLIRRQPTGHNGTKARSSRDSCGKYRLAQRHG